MGVGVTELIEIRQAKPASAGVLARLNADFNGVEEQPEVLAKGLADPHRVEVAILAEMEGRVVGFAGLRVVPSLFYARPYAELTELYVEAPYPRHGVGQALAAYVEDLARAAGAEALAVLTGVTNQPAQALYHGLGYRGRDVMLCKELG
jgi:GNAT superfamily N-acetyltransferase